VSQSKELVVQFLQNVSAAINAREMGCWGDDYGGTRDNYLQGQFEDILQGVPVMAYPLCTGGLTFAYVQYVRYFTVILCVFCHGPRTTGMFQLGNTLGYYLNDIACANISGAHFISVHKRFGLSMPQLLVTHPPPNPLPEKDHVGTHWLNSARNKSDLTLRDPRYAFFNNLPDLIPHNRPLEPEAVSDCVKSEHEAALQCWAQDATVKR
jgi:hypothetical protein